ncbi:MAG: SDR family NAD(P)-dependent oxidoreductase [Eubacteriales bacterium]|nr:SDR family NAD(P)-dependent oxidoreductase [Eubacteriales bacterium]MDD3198610.1 SDR family NAD(P)-dependent oxidoreductase [Eubacteriales bacterium]MDD4683566.1 SDR family NAD(P)-dependent oxidoreductase [Eubacteriales bacterium]
MRVSISGKIVIVTGAGGGIGRAIAVKVARAGSNLALVGGHNLDKLNETAKLVEECGAEAYVLPGDLTNDEFLFSCVKKIVDHFGAIDILINNAGMALNETFEKTSVEKFDQIYRINVRTPFVLCQQVLPYLRDSDAAAIVNISSSLGHKGYAGQAAYAASKHALRGMSKSLANETYTEGIRVHTVCPGGVYTDMLSVARPDLGSEGMIMPDDVAETVLFLLEFRTNAVVDEINIRREGKPPYEI